MPTIQRCSGFQAGAAQHCVTMLGRHAAIQTGVANTRLRFPRLPPLNLSFLCLLIPLLFSFFWFSLFDGI